MTEDIRKMIDKIKNIKSCLNETIENYLILNDEYFIKRIPFFKTFENNSGGGEVHFNHYKNWQKNNAATLHFGKGNGFITFPFLSVETKFSYFSIRKRDFDSESKLTVFKPMFTITHHFNYSTDVHITLPEFENTDEEYIPKQIASLMFKEIIKDNLKFNESFDVKDDEKFPNDKLNNIINIINKNLFKIEEILEKMNLNYF